MSHLPVGVFLIVSCCMLGIHPLSRLGNLFPHMHNMETSSHIQCRSKFIKLSLYNFIQLSSTVLTVFRLPYTQATSYNYYSYSQLVCVAIQLFCVWLLLQQEGTQGSSYSWYAKVICGQLQLYRLQLRLMLKSSYTLEHSLALTSLTPKTFTDNSKSYSYSYIPANDHSCYPYLYAKIHVDMKRSLPKCNQLYLSTTMYKHV